MKRIFYPYVVIALISAMFSSLNVKAQTYTINFYAAPPWTGHGDVNRSDAAPNGIETGVKFYVTQIGTINALRFYRGDSHMGTPTGHLWKNDGTLLGSVTYSSSGSGWQEVNLATPVTVTPGNVYVASVFNSQGWYASTNDYWSDQGGADYGTNPIKVLATGNDPGGVGNGVFIITNSSAFPNQTFQASNYWVDVRFAPLFPLPIVLSGFKATTINSDVLLSWKTESEYNNKGFDIQRSNNGSDWYTINFIKGQSQSVETRNYSYTDKALAPGTYYYRLKQTDLDGRNTFSAIATATIAGKGRAELFQNYPNPFNGTSVIRFDLPKTQMIKLSIVDMTGREVKVLANKLSEAGSHQVTIDAATLQKQLYIVRLQTESGTLTKSILVQ